MYIYIILHRFKCVYFARSDHGPVRRVASFFTTTYLPLASLRWTWKSAAWAILQRRNHRQNGEFPGAGVLEGNAEWMLVLLSLGKFHGIFDVWMVEWRFHGMMFWVGHPTMLATVVSTRICLRLFNMSDGHWWFLSSVHCEAPDLQINLLAKTPADGEILTHKALLWIAVHHCMQQGFLQYYRYI